jgi:hypothetical protein
MLSMKRFLISLSLLAAFLLSATGFADTLIVYSAVGVGYKPGEAINSSDAMTLKSGERLSLISPTGKMIKLVGPFKGVPLTKEAGKDNQSIKKAIQNLLTHSEPGSDSYGITRNTDDLLKLASQPAPLPSPWVIDVTQDGPYCYKEGEKIIFWRGDKSKTTTITIKIEPVGWNAKATWKSGKSKLALPDSIPIKEGLLYKVTLDGKGVEGVLNIIPKTIQSKIAQAAWMKERGCLSQFRTLVHSFL